MKFVGRKELARGRASSQAFRQVAGFQSAPLAGAGARRAQGAHPRHIRRQRAVLERVGVVTEGVAVRAFVLTQDRTQDTAVFILQAVAGVNEHRLAVVFAEDAVFLVTLVVALSVRQQAQLLDGHWLLGGVSDADAGVGRWDVRHARNRKWVVVAGRIRTAASLDQLEIQFVHFAVHSVCVERQVQVLAVFLERDVQVQVLTANTKEN